MAVGLWFVRPLSDASTGVGIPVQRPALLLQWRLGHLSDRDAVLPVRWTDGDEARVTAGATLELGVADRDQRARLGDLVQVRHALSLGVAVGEEPPLGLERRSVVRVQRLVPVEEDVPLLVEELERLELDPGERSARGKGRVRPGL